MKFITKFSMEAKAAIAFIIAQILFKIIFEFEGARIFAESHPMPAFTVIIAFTIAWAVICVLCLANLRIGYLLAIILGVLNLFPLVLLTLGIAPFENHPYFNGWITLSLIYFSYRAYKSKWDRVGRRR
ncbi:MAG: hypothetical protein H8E40_10095 [Chloroflexi bacterium]|nr:hypothetical protein [Chloroflexota bacterium]